jgi:rhodanese-related sulfurtransferase
MSEIAAEELVNLGYTNVWNVVDGMLGWEQAGFSLE